VVTCHIYYDEIMNSLLRAWHKIRPRLAQSLNPGPARVRVKISVGVSASSNSMVRVGVVIVRNSVRVRVSSGLQMAGSRLWSRANFRHNQY